MSEQPFSRKELQDIRDRCSALATASEWMCSAWGIAYNQLAQAADHLDAIMARASVYPDVDRVNYTAPVITGVTGGCAFEACNSPRCSRFFATGASYHCTQPVP